ncbi:MAG: XdhC family protein [Candidatus Pacebacteria bacterium]|nr:XdhC family protein [Candidatus Paceibacterota bacterium]
MSRPEPQIEDGLAIAAEWLKAGRPVALVVVTRTWGSSPRPVGSLMVVEGGGQFAGSVSGGCVEAAVIEAAVQSLTDHQTQALDFGVSDDKAWEFGLACGGKISLMIQPINPADHRAILAAMVSRQQGEAGLLIFGGIERRLEFVTNRDSLYQAMVSSNHSQMIDASRFALLVAPPPRLIIVGAVHIAQALVPLAEGLGFAVTVVDPRQGFATAERFPNVELIHDWPDTALARLGVVEGGGERIALVSMTHEARLDDPALVAALGSDCFYIGALGSKITQAKRLERLRELGFTASQIARIHGPVGLDIGAVTAAEIALSIMAEIIQNYRGRG